MQNHARYIHFLSTHPGKTYRTKLKTSSKPQFKEIFELCNIPQQAMSQLGLRVQLYRRWVENTIKNRKFEEKSEQLQIIEKFRYFLKIFFEYKFGKGI